MHNCVSYCSPSLCLNVCVGEEGDGEGWVALPTNEHMFNKKKVIPCIIVCHIVHPPCVWTCVYEREGAVRDGWRRQPMSICSIKKKLSHALLCVIVYLPSVYMCVCGRGRGRWGMDSPRAPYQREPPLRLVDTMKHYLETIFHNFSQQILNCLDLFPNCLETVGKHLGNIVSWPDLNLLIYTRTALKICKKLRCWPLPLPPNCRLSLSLAPAISEVKQRGLCLVTRWVTINFPIFFSISTHTYHASYTHASSSFMLSFIH